METSWLGCAFSRYSFTVLHSFVLYPQDFTQNACLLMPQQTTALQQMNKITVSKRLQIIPAMVFITKDFKIR